MKPGDLVSVWGRTRPYRLVSSTTVHNSYGDPCPGWVIESADGVRHEAAESVLLVALAPTARRTDPATSHQAADRAAGHAQADRERVLALLAERGPLTDFELAALTGRKQTSIGVRRGELVKAGLVREYDRTGISDTGSPCIRWALAA